MNCLEQESNLLLLLLVPVGAQPPHEGLLRGTRGTETWYQWEKWGGQAVQQARLSPLAWAEPAEMEEDSGAVAVNGEAEYRVQGVVGKVEAGGGGVAGNFAAAVAVEVAEGKSVEVRW